MHESMKNRKTRNENAREGGGIQGGRAANTQEYINTQKNQKQRQFDARLSNAAATLADESCSPPSSSLCKFALPPKPSAFQDPCYVFCIGDTPHIHWQYNDETERMKELRITKTVDAIHSKDTCSFYLGQLQPSHPP
mmetsp:Transcript_19942/g.41748  ORF Transcript_19942/g.41748 Transcript_19942/m.41748 type:complete len:137 (-) Transcript_19942:198-608(-)